VPEEDIQDEETTEEVAEEADAGDDDAGLDLNDRLVVEGVLFSAERPMRIVDIEEATGLERGMVTKALRRLASDYRRRNTSLEVVKVGSRWTMQVRTEYTPSVRAVATPEVDPKYLRTLALIAYHQPVLQADLQQMLGPRVYEHVRELKTLGLVTARRKGATLELTTTQRFPEYFGIESAKRDDIKRFMAERAGIKLETPEEATPLSEEAPPTAGGAPEEVPSPEEEVPSPEEEVPSPEEEVPSPEEEAPAVEGEDDQV
jgi:segregation and condensation protein B